MLRALIVTGLLLMAVGFGAAGWEYYKGLAPAGASATQSDDPAAMPEPQPEIEVRQTWLISPTGGLVPQAEVRAYLVQSRFVPDRTVTVTLTGRLSDLLAEGETLPQPSYLQVLADVRAPMMAEGLCDVLSASVAEDCALHEARVVPDSVDPAAGTAQFRIVLAFREKTDDAQLPDLAAHVLKADRIVTEIEAGQPGAQSAATALAAAIDSASAACKAEGIGKACRIRDLAVEWQPGLPVRTVAEIAWLDPLPEGVFPAPPLDAGPEPATEG